MNKPRWTQETIIKKIQTWATEHDGAPPGWADWETKKKAGDNPVSMTVRLHFGSWSNAIREAGFTPGKGGKDWPSFDIEMATALRQHGMTYDEIAERVGVSRARVVSALRKPPAPVRRPKTAEERRAQRIEALRKAVEHDVQSSVE